MGHSSITVAFRGGIAGVMIVMLGSAGAFAAGSGDDRGARQRPPVYQRHAFEWIPKQGDWRGDWRNGGRGQFVPQLAPSVQSGWFQRPYPYHLDYYRMRYGGSYAPYFGNLYGPPEVVTAPPYYGGYGFGGDLGVYGNAGDGQNVGYGGWPVAGHSDDGVIMSDGPVLEGSPNGQRSMPSGREALPAPTQ